MNKLFTMARQTGRNMMARIAVMLASGCVYQPVIIPSLSSSHHPMPNHRNSSAAADKRCARRRNIAKRRG